MKRIAVLGSTGSIGTNTLDVIASHPQQLELVGIAARSRIDRLEAQMTRYQPRCVAVLDHEKAEELTRRCSERIEVLRGIEGFIRLATHPDVDMVVIGTSGSEALIPLMRAIEARKQIALASKELLVMGGELIMQQVHQTQVPLIPVDSEHAALFQALQGISPTCVERLLITGSGGPLWSMEARELERVSRTQVLSHPKWQMGPKITVDSATLMNKGLEVIEARWLFDVPLDRIRVVIHPQALIHGIVELTDGTSLAQMSLCDMRLPIQFALSYPARWPNALPRVRWTELSALQFFEPDVDRFPCLRLALEAATMGGSAPAVLSAANETAVWAFLREELEFGDIPHIIRETMASHEPMAHPTLDEILQLDRWARQTAQELIRSARPGSRSPVPPLTTAAQAHGLTG